MNVPKKLHSVNVKSRNGGTLDSSAGISPQDYSHSKQTREKSEYSCLTFKVMPFK